MLKVQKKVPLPKAIRPAVPARRKYPFVDMQVGDMFFIPGREKNNLTTHASTVGKQLGRKFVTRLCHMRETKEGWEPCAPEDKGAKTGIGVWRTK